jgi:putative glutamine transport system substrate-binding protein
MYKGETMMKGLRRNLVFLFLMAALVSCGKKPVTEIDEIKSRGVLRAGVHNEIPGFGFVNPDTGLYEGFEIELARLIAAELLGDPGKVDFKPVTPQTTGALLESGTVDLVIGMYTITEERKQTLNFSSPYFTDALGFMVKKGSGIKGLADMNGKRFGVIGGTTSRVAVEAACRGGGLEFEIQDFPSYQEIKEALARGMVDVFVVDKAVLYGYGYGDEQSQILPDAFAPQPYGIVCAKNSTALAGYVNTLIVKWQKDGTIDKLVKQMALF